LATLTDSVDRAGLIFPTARRMNLGAFRGKDHHDRCGTKRRTSEPFELCVAWTIRCGRYCAPSRAPILLRPCVVGTSRPHNGSAADLDAPVSKCQL